MSGHPQHERAEHLELLRRRIVTAFAVHPNRIDPGIELDGPEGDAGVLLQRVTALDCGPEALRGAGPCDDCCGAGHHYTPCFLGVVVADGCQNHGW